MGAGTEHVVGVGTGVAWRDSRGVDVDRAWPGVVLGEGCAGAGAGAGAGAMAVPCSERDKTGEGAAGAACGDKAVDIAGRGPGFTGMLLLEVVSGVPSLAPWIFSARDSQTDLAMGRERTVSRKKQLMSKFIRTEALHGEVVHSTAYCEVLVLHRVREQQLVEVSRSTVREAKRLQ